MARNKMSDLRNHLFETLEALKDEDKPMDIARARAVSEVAGKIIESAKVEVEFMHLAGADGSEFFETPEGLDVRRRKALGALEGGRRHAALG